MPLLLLVVSVALGVWLVAIRRRERHWSLSFLLGTSTLLLLGVGGLGFISGEAALWTFLAAAALLFLMLLVVFVTGQWWAPGGYLAGAVLLFGLGGWLLEPLADFLVAAVKFLLSVEPLYAGWLVLLLLVPLVIVFSFRSMTGLGPVRRWIAISLRCLTLTFLVLALAELHAKRPDDSLTVLFVWDRSLSIPADYGEGKANIDLREERIKQFINEAVMKRGSGKDKDRTGLILFGRRPRLELPPASVSKLYISKFQSPIDDTYTDIAAALKLALASFPEGSAKRIVLISDGNENIGQAEEQARIAKENGVEIDVLPLAAGQRELNEVLVERIEAPPSTEKDTRLPLRIVLRSFHPDIVVGSLHLYKKSLDMIRDQPAGDEPPLFTAQVKLRTGLNVFFYQQPGSKKDDTYTYEARFFPMHVEDRKGQKIQANLAGDRVENNWASVSVMARGQRAILLIEPKAGDHQLLVDRLQKAKPSLKIVAVEPRRLPQDPAQLAVVLSKFDAVILANIPAETRDEEKLEVVGLTEEQQKVLRSNTHDQGAGMIVIGGPNSYGAGGWQGTELEKAWPVTSDLKSIKVEGKNGLVLIMHASEMAEGNAWQKKIAKLAFEKLAEIDMIGVLHYNGMGAEGHTWHIPFQEIGNKRGKLIRDLDSMLPGDMPDADPSLKMALGELSKREYNLGTKHIIFISDGDHWVANPGLLARIKAAKITCTTVCITTHGPGEIKQMALVAGLTGGRSYHVTNPANLPAIYIKETRLVSKSFVHEKAFRPILSLRGGPTEGLQDLPDLHGFVRTTRRPGPLVEVPIKTPKLGESDFPILATWQYGLGKTVAFTSDARSLLREKENFWDKDWAGSNMYIKFWEQTVDYVLRPTESGEFLHLATEHKDGKVRVTVEANDNDADKTPLTNIDFKVGVSSPSFKGQDSRKVEVKLEQKSPGVYEAEFQADEVGAYFLNVRAEWQKDGKPRVDNVRAGVTIPYSPEFAEVEGNRSLLEEKIAKVTGGKVYEENELLRAARSGDVFRANPHGQQSLQTLWPWLVLLAGMCLFFDVAIRRIAIEPAALWAKAGAVWGAIRRQESAVATTVFLERLQSRKAQVGEALEKQKAKRFEGQEGTPSAVPEATVAGPAGDAPPRPAPPAKKAPKEEEPADFATRLMRAKKKAMEDRDNK